MVTKTNTNNKKRCSVGEYCLPRDLRGADRSSLLYGRKGVLEVLKCQPELVARVFVGEGVKLPEELEHALLSSRETGVVISLQSLQSLTELCQAAKHQGVVAQLKAVSGSSFEEILQRGIEQNGLIVLLDQVVDPHNLGSILRAAEGAGASGVILTKDNSASLTPVVRKVSAGASELLPICRVTNLCRAISQLKDKGYQVIGADVGRGSTSLFEYKATFPLALIFGSEGKGLRRLTRENCDLLLQIPMRGNIESLNVGQAAAVFLFEILKVH